MNVIEPPTISVANVRDLPPPAEWPAWFVWVGGRSSRRGLKVSPLANPYRVGQYPTRLDMQPLTREDTLYWYRAWRAFSHDLGILFELGRLNSLLKKHGRLVLVCRCAPKPCHAEVIREWLENHWQAAMKGKEG